MLSDQNADSAQIVPPGAVDLQIRQAVSLCWMALPHEKKTLGALRSEIQRIVTRVLRDVEEDDASLGFTWNQSDPDEQ